jgi:hypothetical protein
VRAARSAVAALSLWVIGSGLWAQGVPPVTPSAGPTTRSADGSQLTISVLTFGQGDAIWERFGHNALRVRDAQLGTDVAYNWGTFDFEQPNFIGRFLTGNTLYWLATDPTPLMIEHYARVLNRSGVEQVLALTPQQRLAIRDFVAWNARPENRNYRYDYFVDNCSTRLRDVIDRVLGGELRRQLAARPSAHTYRSESLRLVDGMHLLQAGMDVALARPADLPLTAWEESFVPMRLRDRLRDVQVVGADGARRPLVAEERVLYESTRAPEAARMPSLVGRFLVVGLLLAGLVVGLSALAERGRRGARAGLAAVGGVWGFLAGVMGAILAIAWLATRHVFWYRNENLLQFAPVAIVLAVLLPLAVYRPRWRGAAFTVAALVAALSALGLLLKVFPAFRQQNLAVVLLALPVHAALGWALRPRRAD